MATYLLTWNPERWHWENLPTLAARNIRGQRIKERWSTGLSRRMVSGDHFFLLQQGTQGRGLIGAGVFTSGVTDGPHFSGEGEMTYANVRFERLIDPVAQPERRFDVNDLQKLPGGAEFNWATQRSGIEMPDELAHRVEEAWAGRQELGYPDGVTRDDVLFAIAELRRGREHAFADSIRYDVLYEGERFPPKAVAGLAAERVFGRLLTPYDFKAGEGSKMFRVLRDLGFEIVPKGKDPREEKGRNPDWTRDELILALDLYVRFKPNELSARHPEVTALSTLLNQLPLHPRASQGFTFRNPNGVYMKLSNFLRIDPSYEGDGLKGGNKLEQVVWDEFAGDHERLRRTAMAIKSGFSSVARPETQEESEADEEEEFAEGRVLTALHRRRERNPKLVRKKKEAAIRDHGFLRCEACSFDFEKEYGLLGTGFAECHHTKPISELSGAGVTKLKDLALVCANCHRMLHRSRPMLSVGELKALIQQVHL